MTVVKTGKEESRTALVGAGLWSDRDPRNPYQDYSAARDVVLCLAERGFTLQLEYDPSGCWAAAFHSNFWERCGRCKCAQSETVAICEAALQLVHKGFLDEPLDCCGD